MYVSTDIYLYIHECIWRYNSTTTISLYICRYMNVSKDITLQISLYICRHMNESEDITWMYLKISLYICRHMNVSKDITFTTKDALHIHYLQISCIYRYHLISVDTFMYLQISLDICVCIYRCRSVDSVCLYRYISVDTWMYLKK